MATALGVISLILGASEIFMSKTVAESSGLDEKYIPVLRVFGLREILSGVGLLASKNKTKWFWSRVIGDALDSAFLGWAFF